MKITIGKPIANTQIYIVDSFLQPVPIGITGELCIAGDGVGAGYLNRPELTAERFIDNPFGKGKLYKTGDLAYWREDGNIVYVGRNDFQVKIRGLRIELGEIENAISSIDGITQAVVIVRKNNEGRQLICAFYTGREIDAKGIRSQIGGRLPKYMLPHIITHIDEMPLTPSGKINRKALPEIDLGNIDSGVEYVAPETDREKTLVRAISEVLDIETVGVLDNFFDLGGDSLKAIELTSVLEEAGYTAEIKTIFDSANIKSLAEKLTIKECDEAHREYGDVIPSTPAQMRVYTAQSMNAASTLYNVPFVFRAQSVDVARLQTAVNRLIERHEALRTHFENQNGRIMQVIDATASVRVELLSSDNISDFVKPFDLSVSPLLRVGVFENTVMFDLHHIIADGGTMPVFFRELNELYMGREPKSDPVQYGEFAVTPVDTAEDERYWLSVFDDELPVLEMNTDFPRTDKQSFSGAAEYGVIPGELHNKIKEKCKALNITSYVFYMAAFSILLSKFSNNEDIVIGMPISGRSPKYLNTVGMFVNTVALRTKPDGEKDVDAFLREVKEISVATIDHQNYPFGELVKKIHAETPGRNPLFDVMFAYQSEEMTDIVFNDEKAELLPIPVTSAKCDFTFNIMPQVNGAALMVEYCTALYQQKTIQRLIAGYRQVLSDMLNTTISLKDVSAITQEEKQRLLFEFNDTDFEYPKDKLVHHLIEQQATEKPNDTATVSFDRTTTFLELNEEANKIAHSLIEMGIKRGDIVAVILPRNSHLIPALLGVLKTGAAYMPVDPSYPQERIDYLLAESNAKYIINDNSINKLIDNDCISNPNVPVSLSDYFCALHTSGSTGKPKLTVLRQSNLLNFLYGNLDFWDHVETVVCVTIVTFDIFMQDTLLSLALGKKLILASNDQIYNQAEFEKMFENEDNIMFFSTPTKLTAYIKQSETCLFLQKIISLIVGGEVFSDELYDLLLSKFTKGDAFNGYGPSETTLGIAFNKVLPPPEFSNSEHYLMRMDRQKHHYGLQKTRKIINIYGPAETTMWVSTDEKTFEEYL